MSQPGTGFDPDMKLRKLCAVVSFGPFLSLLDTTIVNVALSHLSQELHAPLSTIQWVTTGYLLSLALMIPLSGWLVAKFGAKRVYLGSFALFTSASTCCGLAQNVETLLFFRFLQGMAGGLLAPMAQMMAARYAGNQISRVMAMISLPVLVAPMLGPTLAGFILQFASWHWLFLFNLPVGVLAIAAAIAWLPADDELRPRRFDWLGFALVSPGLILILDGMHRFASPGGLLLGAIELATAIGMLTTFTLRALRSSEHGLIDMRLFLAARFSNSAITQFLGNATGQGGLMLIPLYLILGRKLEPSTTGIIMAAMGLGVLSTRLVIDKMIRTLGPRATSMIGAGISLAFTLPLMFEGLPLPVPVLLVVLLLRGFGQGLINLPSVTSAYSAIPRESLPDAATAINVVQRLGGPVATMGIALTLGGAAAGAVHTDVSFSLAFVLLCAMNVATLWAASRLVARI